MRLSTFIEKNMEAILVEWEKFARTRVPAAASMNDLLLRDHARQILEAVLKDIAAPQSDAERDEKSLGDAPALPEASETAAETHGWLRAKSGFDIGQMASEYRALRASVLRLWMEALHPDAPDLGDVIRFNEAIDQALAESIKFFAERLEESRRLFLSTLSHDMRTPLQAMQLTAQYLLRLNAGESVSAAARRLIDSGSRMKNLLDDLIEYNRATLGLGLVLAPSPQNMATLFADEVEQLRAAYPERQLDVVVQGPTKGIWDGPSLRRLLSNLVVNAIKYGKPDAPIVIALSGEDDEIHFEVRNEGAPLDTLTLQGLFDPLKRGLNSGLNSGLSADVGLGLGLHIARQVARAHNGDIGARSEDGETAFFVRIPMDASSSLRN
ncbi:MAG TPA: sensor histidine kinase [Polaromonas sp.]|uniref:sensor histidine kinase n=1 Tax=Polaromonas sp. TaxID=1869339 RepID=UPI002D3EF1C1|nr:sensor histidine kinase [Polaromonas sp.]HYW56424.1 sensor histidine kinase [Polaromonas sp.]